MTLEGMTKMPKYKVTVDFFFMLLIMPSKKTTLLEESHLKMSSVITILLLAVLKIPKTEVLTGNGLLTSVLSGRVSCSSSGDRRVH